MDLVLIALGVLGFSAIAIAAYVFTVAARNYVSSDQFTRRQDDPPSDEGDDMDRNTRHRRDAPPVQFPFSVNDITVAKDRRKSAEPRKEPGKSAHK